MLSTSPGKVRTGNRSVCVVAGPGELTGGNLALTLRVEQLREQGCRLDVLDPTSLPEVSVWRSGNILNDPTADASDRVRVALQRHCREHGVAEVLFPTRGGLAFRAIQAKQASLAFRDVTLTVLLDEPAVLQRKKGHRYATVADLQREHAERYSFEMADARFCLDTGLLEAVRRCGWETNSQRLYPQATDSSPLVTVCLAHYNHGRYLPDALTGLAAQTYGNLEVLVIDDGSKEPFSQDTFQRMQRVHASFRFLQQNNSGIGATRNRGLREAKGEYFIPVDADNIACPDMIERLVAAIQSRPDVAAMSCYFLAFTQLGDIAHERFAYSCRPTGGPRVLASLSNVYGDANAIYRTDELRAVGGYEIDRETSFEDWEAFVKLANSGRVVDVVPDHLFYYRHLPTGFSRTTSAAANHARVLRQFSRLTSLPEGEREQLWSLLAGLHAEARRAMARQQSRRYRLADWVADVVANGLERIGLRRQKQEEA